MLKYKHVSRSATYNQNFYIADSGAYRVTNTYVMFSPDIKYYYKNCLHRTDGPSHIDLESGRVTFNVNGHIYGNTKAFCEVAGMSDEDKFMWVLRFGDKLPQTCEEYYGEGWKDMSLDEF